MYFMNKDRLTPCQPAAVQAPAAVLAGFSKIDRVISTLRIAVLPVVTYLVVNISQDTFEICDPGLGVWVNDVNIIWNEKEAGQWEMRPNVLLLCLFRTNCNIFLFSTVWLIWNSHFKLATCQ